MSFAAVIGAPAGAAPGPLPYSAASDASRYFESTQVAVNRCADAVQLQLGRNRYGNGAGDGYSAARVLGINRVEPRAGGGSIAVNGVATSGRYSAVADGARRPVDLVWRCTSDRYGTISGIDIAPAPQAPAVGYDISARSYEGDDYSQYGYRRY